MNPQAWGSFWPWASFVSVDYSFALFMPQKPAWKSLSPGGRVWLVSPGRLTCSRCLRHPTDNSCQ